MMKALILSAGLGTRLLPYTNHTPKPLFPVDGQPLLDRLIRQLKASGCRAVGVNTHHLHEKIETHIASQSYGIPVVTRHEPEVLGTGGAIRNFSDFWDDRPFLVVNADILTNIDFKTVFEFHCRRTAPATLVLLDAPPLNSVTVDGKGRVSRFLSPSDPSPMGRHAYTFTGIQVLDPRVLPLMPETGFFNSIDLYRRLISENDAPLAFIDTHCLWQDLGTPDRYKAAAREEIATSAFREAFDRPPEAPFEWTLLEGDGSDRTWYRVRSGQRTLIASDHGITPAPEPSEIDSVVSIGRHLQEKGLPVPAIYRHDLFSGWVVMDDLGDTHLQTAARDADSPDALAALYRQTIDVLIRFSSAGIEGFDPAWTSQSAAYDRPLILQRECEYFLDAFLKGYMGHDPGAEALKPAFEKLAEGALAGAVTGLMHRDFQSRNILIHHGRPCVIDYQGARRGPFQYDLASLLIDPYAALPESLQENLYAYAATRLSERLPFDPHDFRRCYEFCRITRNLQILGAFGHLSKARGKRQFEKYIPAALGTLKKNLDTLALPEVLKLKKTVTHLTL